MKSLVMASIEILERANDQPLEEPITKKVPRSLIFDSLGLPRSTAYRMSKSLRDMRRDIRRGVAHSGWKLIQSRNGFWGKITMETRLVVDKWIRNHHNVMHSPLKSHTVKVVDPFSQEVVRKNKLLLQCSVQELHCDMCLPGIGIGDVLIDSNGNDLVSDAMFRDILLPELRLLAGT